MTLVSGVMPTRGRQAWARQALDCYRSQTYANRELFILDDSDDPSFPEPPTGEGIRYVRSPDRMNIPKKRNICGYAARGEIIMNFDSDDWSAPERMAEQVERLLESGKAVTGYHTLLFDADGDAYEYRGYKLTCSGTSLAFLKSWWHAHQFDEGVTLSTDMRFIGVARDAGELVCSPSNGLMVARVHTANSNPKRMRKPFVKIDRSALPAAYLALEAVAA